MKLAVLQKVLSKNEALVYLKLLRLGNASASQIIDATGLHRANVYDALDRLAIKGLVSNVIRKNKNFFEAAHPGKIIEILEDKKKVIDVDEENIKAVMPELELDFNMIKERQEVHYYKGKEGLKTLYDEIYKGIKPKTKMYAIGAMGTMRDIFKYSFKSKWLKMAEKKNVKFHILYYSTAKKIPNLRFSKNLAIRFLPESVKLTPSTTYIFENKFAIVSLDTMIGVLIENKDIVSVYKSYFELMWSVSEEN